VFGLVHEAINGSDESELLAPSSTAVFPLDWSADGRFVLYQQDNPATRSDILLLPLAKGSTPVPFVNSAANERDAQFSPDGKWIAYTSDTSGSPQIYVQAFQGARAASEPHWRVSQNGGDKPKWRHDGRELFFIATDGQLMAAAVSGNTFVFDAQPPRALFPTTLNAMQSYTNTQVYAPALDGKGFFILQSVREPGPPLIVVSDWSKLRP
jgi:Tol biopolymer transport system component